MICLVTEYFELAFYLIMNNDCFKRNLENALKLITLLDKSNDRENEGLNQLKQLQYVSLN